MRVFVAVEIREEGVLEAIRGVQNELELGARPVAAENMHFTLQFLGEVSEGRISRVVSALKSVTFSPFELAVQGMGAFPGPKAPRVIWAGTDAGGGEKMKKLARGVEDALRPLGFSQDRAFRPHLTIFRIKNRVGDITKDLDRFGQTRFGKVTVSEIKLKQSRLAPSGPAYSDLGAVAAG